MVGTSDELHCFITEEFNYVNQIEADDMRNAVLALGRLQVRSLAYLEDLREAGCPNRDLKLLPQEMSKIPFKRHSLFGVIRSRSLRQFCTNCDGYVQEIRGVPNPTDVGARGLQYSKYGIPLQRRKERSDIV